MAFHSKLTDLERRVLLLSHSFSGCDTVSAVFGFGKVRFFKKLSSPAAPRDVIDVLTTPGSSPESVKRAGVKLFEFLYTNSKAKTNLSLAELRYHAFSRMSAKGAINPERLPPSKDAAEQHSLRAYLQVI